MEKFYIEKNDDEIYNKTDFLIRGDYANEISFLEDIIKNGDLKKIGIRHIKTIDERYNDITKYFEKFYNKNEINLFWKKKEQLDILIPLLNNELQKEKESRDEIEVKKIYNKICLIIFTKESPGFVHTPFPEVDKIN